MTVIIDLWNSRIFTGDDQKICLFVNLISSYLCLGIPWWADRLEVQHRESSIAYTYFTWNRVFWVPLETSLLPGLSVVVWYISNVIDSFHKVYYLVQGRKTMSQYVFNLASLYCGWMSRVLYMVLEIEVIFPKKYVETWKTKAEITSLVSPAQKYLWLWALRIQKLQSL